MKKFSAILVVLSISSSWLQASPLMEELVKVENLIISKDNQIEALNAVLAAKDKEIAELKANPDLDQVIRVKFNQVLMDTKTSISRITEEIVSKLKNNNK